MRIVSLSPSATEILCALGLESSLVGVSHECDWPISVRDLPRLTRSLLPETQIDEDGEILELSALEIDNAVREAVASGESLFTIDIELLRELKPDLLVTQGLCNVCAVHHKTALIASEALDKAAGAMVLDLSPTTLAEVLETFRQIGTATQRDAEAESLIAKTKNRWDAVREKTQTIGELPRTLLLEWPEPSFSAGHWNPELLQIAGGMLAPWDIVGKPSRVLDWTEVLEFNPEYIVLIACGFDAYRSLDEAWPLSELPGWYDLPAVRNGDCYAADGNAFFNRPGPRLADSAEILATILRPEVFTDMLPPYSVQRFPDEMLVRIEDTT
jgi:iron complex transport system substrate-binding protein